MKREKWHILLVIFGPTSYELGLTDFNPQKPRSCCKVNLTSNSMRKTSDEGDDQTIYSVVKHKRIKSPLDSLFSLLIHLHFDLFDY